MKHARLILPLLIMLPFAARSQTAIAPVTPKSTSGDFALLFDLGGLASLALNGFNGPGGDTSEYGAGFGAKYFVANDVAVRIGLTLRSLSRKAPVTDTLLLNDEFTSFRFAIAPSVTYNLVKSSSVAGYVGGQLTYAMANATNTPSDTTKRATDATSSTFGIGALIGAEWFPWSNVSIAGEYIVGFATSSEERTETIGSGEPKLFELPSETAVGINSRGVLTLAIYW